MRLNRSVSYKEKNGVYVFYREFNYLFFSGQAAHLISRLLSLLSKGESLNSISGTFLEYLKTKNIIEEGDDAIRF